MNRLRRTIPYLIVLAVTAALFVMATRIEFAAPGGRIGPNFWPKAILALATITCLYQIVKTLLFDETAGDVSGVLETVIEDTTAEAEADTSAAEPAAAERTYPRLLVGGIVLTLAYVALIERVGFVLCTFAYLAAFAWVGGYRRPVVVLTASLVGSLAFMFVFMKIVYVSLPLGQEPFSQVTLLLMRLMGIR